MELTNLSIISLVSFGELFLYCSQILRSMKIEIKRLSEAEIQAKGIKEWSIWSKEVSKFYWEYDSAEECYFLEGKVIVTTKNERVEISAGDFVRFPAGLTCTWNVLEPVRKHYFFE